MNRQIPTKSLLSGFTFVLMLLLICMTLPHVGLTRIFGAAQINPVLDAQQDRLYIPMIGSSTSSVTPTPVTPTPVTPTPVTPTPVTPTPVTPTPVTPTPVTFTEQLFVIHIGDEVSPNVPSTGAGNIESDNQKDVYTFQADAGQGVFFDEVSDHDCFFIPYLFWQLMGPGGAILFDETFGGTTALGVTCDAGLYRIEQGGTYTLTVYGSPTDYVFALIEVPADLIDIELNQLVQDGSPQPGAGNIEASLGKDFYRFTVSPGQRIYIQLGEVDVSASIDWKLYDGENHLLYHHCVRYFCDFFDPGIQTLMEGGTYYLAIGNDFPDVTGTYYLTVWNVPEPEHFQINIGDSVSDGSLGAGSGRTESPGYQDAYEFTATPGQQVYLVIENDDLVGVLTWKLIDEDGNEVVRTCEWLDFSCPGVYGDPGVLTLGKGGKYQLVIGNEKGTVTGSYRFTLLDVPPPDYFDIHIGDNISDGIPGVGAGNIESPTVKDVYRFTAEAGQKVFFDLKSTTLTGEIAVKINSVDETVYGGCIGLCYPPGVVTFVRGGPYEIIFGSDTGVVIGTYEFQSWDVASPQVFNIAIGDEVSNGNPNVGAGNLESPGTTDIYHFTAPPKQRVILEIEPVNLSGEVGIILRDQLQVIATYCINGICGTPPEETLARGGNYELIIGNTGGNVTGTYRFKIVPVAQSQ